MEAVVIRDGQRVITKQEIDIVQALSNGLSASETGDLVGLSGRTIESYTANLRRDFECKSTVHLVAVFLRKKIIQ